MTKKVMSKQSEPIDFDGVSIAEAIEQLTKLGENIGYNYVLENTYRWDGDTSLFVTYNALETDQEYACRLNREAAQEAVNQAHRRKQYEALKKEFEN